MSSSSNTPSATFLTLSFLLTCHDSHIVFSIHYSQSHNYVLFFRRGRDDGNSSGGVEQDEPTQRDGEDAEGLWTNIISSELMTLKYIDLYYSPY